LAQGREDHGRKPARRGDRGKQDGTKAANTALLLANSAAAEHWDYPEIDDNTQAGDLFPLNGYVGRCPEPPAASSRTGSIAEIDHCPD